MRRWWRECAVAIFDSVVPRACAACGVAAPGLCDACRSRLEELPERGCARCGEPVLEAGQRCTGDHRGLAGIVIRRAAWRYRGTGGAIVRRFKFDGDPVAREMIVRATADRLRGWIRSGGRRAVFVNVPVHPRKRRHRGFDQAARIADGVALRLGRPFIPGALCRVVETLPQGDPRVTSRDQNVAGAFRIVRPAAIRDRVVVLVDDVSTSGATARECARVLREHGARAVVLLTAALGR